MKAKITPLFSDRFLEANGAWKRVEGEVRVHSSGGSAIATTSAKAVVDVGAQDCVVRVSVVYCSVEAGALLRWKDKDNHLRAALGPCGWKLEAVVGGGILQLAQGGRPLNQTHFGNDRPLQVAMDGEVLTITDGAAAPGVVRCPHFLDAKQHGIYAVRRGGIFRSFEVVVKQ